MSASVTSVLDALKAIGLSEAGTGWFLFTFIIVIPATSLLFNFLRWKNQKNDHHLKKEIALLEKKRELTLDIDERLTTFLLPLKHYLSQSKMIYDTFAINEKAKARASGENFNTLRYICKGGKFSETDRAKLKDIIKLGNQQNELIEEKGWKIEDLAFDGLLSRYSTHLKLLNIANSCFIKPKIEEISNHTFPIELPGAVQSKIFSLQEEKESLSISLERGSKKKVDLRIQKYNRNADEYYKKTIKIEPSHDIKDFARLVKGGGLICDIGCGSGRDSIYFIQNGYRVLSTEPSLPLADLAENYPFIYVKKISILEMSYKSSFDGIWCSAVLQHIKRKDLNETIYKLSRMTKKDGYLYISYRRTASLIERFLDGVETHNADKVRYLLNKHGFEIITSKETQSTLDMKNKFRSFLAKKIRS
jgi:2-polyprenyl-3-methyl-5-hydroxy-6-metoxy-1,4-benzoquinol methylase